MRFLATIVTLMLAGFIASGQTNISVNVDRHSHRLTAPLDFFQANSDKITNMIDTALASANTNAVWPNAGTNVTATTNGTVVTINADVSHTEVSSASNLAYSAAISVIGSIGGNLTNQLNLASNLLALANAATSNSIAPTAQTIANTSSNLVYGNALTQINATSNSVVSTAQTIANSSSNQLADIAISETNNMGISSGLAAFRSTNSFASTNVATSSTFGLGKPDNVTLGVSGGVWSVIGGGGGGGAATNVYFIDSTTATWDIVGGSNRVTVQTNFADLAGTAMAATNALGLGSALSANVSTNRFAPTNAPKIFNPENYGRVHVHGIGAGIGQIGVDDIDVEDMSDLTITPETPFNFVIIWGGIKLLGEDGNPWFLADGTAQVLYANGSGLTNLNASNISSGTVPPANLGSGSSISTKFLRGDSTWQTISGGGDMLAANNLSDVASKGAALQNINGVSNNWAGTVTGSGLNLSGGITNSSLTASTLLTSDANKKVSSLANGSGILTNNGSGGFGWTPDVMVRTNQLLDATSLRSNAYVMTGVSTQLLSTIDAGNPGWTNIITWSNPASTNIAVVFNGTSQTITLTNKPKDVWLSFSGANGSIAILCPTNTTLHLPYPIKWAFYSNNVVTNGVFSLSSFGGTNFGQLWGAIGEGL